MRVRLHANGQARLCACVCVRWRSRACSHSGDQVCTFEKFRELLHAHDEVRVRGMCFAWVCCCS
jgi:hypothetical protein